MNTIQPILVSPKEACHLLGIKYTKLYELLKTKKLDRIKIGKATRITMASILAIASVSAGGKDE
jgi:excisionase family DNA binding protein